MSDDKPQKVNTGTLVTGFVLISIGVLFLLERFEVASFGELIHTWWPLIFIIIGVPKLFERDTFWAGLWFLTIGAWLQAVRLHLYGLTYSNSWPLLLIVIGAGMVVRTFIDAIARRQSDDSGPEEKTP
jgi:hypothetical protein